MGPIENLSRYGYGFLPNVDRHGDEILVIAIAARFALPQPGRPHAGPLEPTPEQAPPSFADVYWGDPATTSLRTEGLSAYTRPGTDVYLSGSAWAPGGRPVERMEVELRVGPCGRVARVTGDRVWVEIEDPRGLVSELWSRPDPVGFGPIGRHWSPRSSYAGTYDEDWTRERAPLWPEDFDERFFLAASPGMHAVPHLRGGETVVLSGVHPGGGFGFRLPTVRLSCKSVYHGRTDRVAMRLDAVTLEPDEGSLTLAYRATVELGRGGDHRYTVVRELEAGEATPPMDPVRGPGRGPGRGPAGGPGGGARAAGGPS